MFVVFGAFGDCVSMDAMHCQLISSGACGTERRAHRWKCAVTELLAMKSERQGVDSLVIALTSYQR